jgi:hypothetical protein
MAEVREAAGSGPETAPEANRVTEASTSDNTEPITGASYYMLIVSLTLASLLVFLDTAVVSTAVPKVTDEFHSLTDVGWYGSAYQLGRYVIWCLLCFDARHNTES